jgi:hypothetical protein
MALSTMSPFMPSRLKILLFLAAAPPAFAAEPFDGTWTISTATLRGACSAYSLDIGIVNGRVQTPSGVLVSGSGSVSPKGRVFVRFVAGSDVISASGQASRGTASGRWVAPTLACSGRWSGQRR